jgi:hypothetical protein
MYIVPTNLEETTTAMQQQPRHYSAAMNQHATIYDGIFHLVCAGAT